MKYVVFLDIDGVLADNTHRLNYMFDKDYDKFYSYNEVVKDGIIARGRFLAVMYAYCDDFDIVLVTGRNESCKQATVDWLRMAAMPYDRILMRGHDDHREASELKPELIRDYISEHPECTPIMFIDDEELTVEAVAQAFPQMACMQFK